LLSLSKLLDRV